MLVIVGGSLRLMLTPLWLTLQFMLTFTLLQFTFLTGLRPILMLIDDWFRYFRQERLMVQLRLLIVCQISLAPLLLPNQLQTFLIIVSVRAKPALSPSQTSCQSLVLLSRFRASLWLLSLAQQVAMFLKMSCTMGIPSKRQLQKRELSFCRFLNFFSASLILFCFMSASPKQFQALKYSSINFSFNFLMLDDDQSCSWMAWAALLSPFLRQSSSKWTNPTNLKCSSLIDLYSLSASQKSQFNLQASPRRIMYLLSSDSAALTFFRYSTFRSQTSRVSLKQPDIWRITAWLLSFSIRFCRQSQFLKRMVQFSVSRFFEVGSLLFWQASAKGPQMRMPFLVATSISSNLKKLQILKMTFFLRFLSSLITNPKSSSLCL